MKNMEFALLMDARETQKALQIEQDDEMTTTQLIGGLEGAIGSAFVPAQNRLLFVGYGGRLSRYDRFPAAAIVSQGSAVLQGTFLFDLGPRRRAGRVFRRGLRAGAGVTARNVS